MTRSVNEVEMQIQKACRGAGLCVGQAQVIADALVRDIAGLPTLLATLAQGRRVSQLAGTARCIIENADILLDGPAACDALNAGVAQVTLMGLGDDALARALFAGAGAGVEATGTGLVITGPPNRAARPRRVTVAGDLWDQLDQYAHKVYVPETEASRLAGAGAGLTDND